MRRAGRAARTSVAPGHVRARAAILRDQQDLARHLWLAGAVALGVPALLAGGTTVDELGDRLDSDGSDRLEAWLALGAVLGEVRVRRHRVHATGHRLRALVDGDRLVTAWYRSLSTFGTEIPLGIGDLLAGRTDRTDPLDEAPTIAALAELTDPVVHPALAEALDATAASSIADVGCGDGRLLAAALAHRPGLRAVGFDQAPAAIAAARDRLGDAAGVELVTARLEDVDQPGTFDVVVTANTSYYCPTDELPAFCQRLAALVAPGGALVVATAVAAEPAKARGPVRPVAVASALLDLQLRCQPGTLRLPTSAQLRAAMATTGLDHQATHWSRAGLPYLVIRGRRP